MKTTLNLLLTGMMFVFLNGCKESKVDTKVQPEFKGKVAKTYEESEEWWASHLIAVGFFFKNFIEERG